MIWRINEGHLFSIEMRVSQEWGLWPSEAHHGQGHRNGHVDSNLPCFNFISEFSGCSSIGSENSCAIAIHVLIDKLDSFIHGIDIDHAEDRPEDFLLVGLHFGVHLVDNGWAYKVAIGVFVYFDSTTIKLELNLEKKSKRWTLLRISWLICKSLHRCLFLNLPLWFKLVLIEGFRCREFKFSKWQCMWRFCLSRFVLCYIWIHDMESLRLKQVWTRATSSKINSDADFSKLVN